MATEVNLKVHRRRHDRCARSFLIIVHLRMLEVAAKNNFRFDAVQMPLSVMDAHFRSFEKEVLPVLVREQIGVLGMKSMGSGSILRSKTVSAIECLHYALNLPTSVVITGIDSME
jgi:hypothetical protein